MVCFYFLLVLLYIISWTVRYLKKFTWPSALLPSGYSCKVCSIVVIMISEIYCSLLVLDWSEWWEYCSSVQVLEVWKMGDNRGWYPMELCQVSSWQGWASCWSLLSHNFSSYHWGKTPFAVYVWFSKFSWLMLPNCSFMAKDHLILSKWCNSSCFVTLLQHDIKKLLGVSEWTLFGRGHPKFEACDMYLAFVFVTLCFCVCAPYWLVRFV